MLRFPPTYVFVEELALVPVVQVNEFGRTLLLSVHPGTYVLTTRLCVEIGALPVPGKDRKHMHSPRTVESLPGL